MARMTLEEKLAAVTALAQQPVAPGRWDGWLREPSNIVLARVAEMIARTGERAYLPQLTELFLRLVDHPQPASVDKVCRAKEAIVTALESLGNQDSAPYLRGIRHVQMEPVWGGRADTAAALRGQCALALARLHDFYAHFALLPLLFDPELPARLAGARAITYLGDERSELLLRAKALGGDADPSVVGECLTGLLLLEPERSLPFVKEFLWSAEQEAVEQAALALGNTKLDAAFPLLRARWEENSDFELRKSLLLAMALTRTDAAFDYLLALMCEGGSIALLACEVLALYGVDPRYRARIAEVVAACRNPRLSDAFTAQFPAGP